METAPTAGAGQAWRAAIAPQAEVQQSNAVVNYVAMGLIIAFTAITVVNTLAMSVFDRRRPHPPLSQARMIPVVAAELSEGAP
ncbi:hypothetical protein [Streptomyces lavendulocolor]|uniref:hypothetical protein n=1 Tax=Streptomyces lavendulocolor TaxID=67316 RepID=UPI0031D2FAF0